MNIFEIYFQEEVTKDDIDFALDNFGFHRYYVEYLDDDADFASAFVVYFDEQATEDEVDTALSEFGSFHVEARED